MYAVIETLTSVAGARVPRDSVGVARQRRVAVAPIARGVDVPVSTVHALADVRAVLAARLPVDTPVPDGDDVALATWLADGVHLCALVNSIRPRAVPAVHRPINVNEVRAYTTRGQYGEHICSRCHRRKRAATLRISYQPAVGWACPR